MSEERADVKLCMLRVDILTARAAVPDIKRVVQVDVHAQTHRC